MSNAESRRLLVVDDEIEICNFVKMFFENDDSFLHSKRFILP